MYARVPTTPLPLLIFLAAFAALPADARPVSQSVTADAGDKPRDYALRHRRVAYVEGSDADRDGIGDAVDRCPGSIPQARLDAVGCMQAGQLMRLYDVDFRPGGTELDTDARMALAPVARALRQQRDLRIRVDGHTDSTGDSRDNLQLSRERARSVATWLMLQGVAAERIDTRGHGETRPVESNATAEGRKRNRRIEIILLDAPALALETNR